MKPLPILFALLVLGAPANSVRAQVSNADQMARIAVACAARAVGEVDAVALDGPDRLPFVRSALVNAWMASGITVLDASAIQDRRAAHLSARVESASVSYARADAGLWQRSVSVRLRMRTSAADATILFDDSCGDTLSDFVAPGSVGDLEDAAFPETVGSRPPDGFLRRIIQPVVIGAATAVGVALFFTLRSRRAGEGG